MIVRPARGFELQLVLWCALYFAGFYALNFFWRIRRFGGDQGILPALHLLTGIGLILMISLRDPLRDTLTFSNFAQGVIAGCVLMAAVSLVDFERVFGGLSFVPLALSVAISIALILFGSGPGTSDAKVNLFGFQPVEAIKILLVFFLAGYFASRWEFLRELREKRPALAHIARHIEIPRLDYMLPVLVSVALVLVFFYLQKDLGPALVFACLFLVLYAVARNRVAFAAFGAFLLIGGFASGYLLGFPKTVSERVQMWLSPWDNAVHGGEQVVHSLWAMSSGGILGAGLGLGEPAIVPAGHTDLILSVLGEEWGFAGIMCVALLYAALLLLSLRIALRARTDYAFFLALGLVLLTGFEILLIAGGILDLVPLSGVVTPFLSYGRTAMMANFIVFGILLSLSRQAGKPGQVEPFRPAVKAIGIGMALFAGAILLKAAYIQVIRPDAITGAGTLVVQADGARRYQYNPRLLEIARQIPRGSIFDRNGVPLATSDWSILERSREQFSRMGIDIDQACNRADSRYYPLGASAFHLLGDLRTHANWSATNSSLAERDSAVQLQGYDDRARVVRIQNFRNGQAGYTVRYNYAELLPLLRHRHEPNNAAVRRVLDRNRDLQMSIDARLQRSASDILRNHLRRLGKQRGALVVLDPESGDLLAAVSEPSPTLEMQTVSTDASEEALLDRARYGLYPPGSTFKIVTSMAALRTNPAVVNQKYECVRLPDGRVGNYIGKSKRPIRDDVADKTPHGTLDLAKALVISCNAYFAQLGTYDVGAKALLDTANLLGISVANPPTAAKLRDALPQASYGQGQVVASPFQMARVAAAVVAGGAMPYGRWVIDQSNTRVQAAQSVLPAEQAAVLARDMRMVVTSGTGRSVSGSAVPIAGKTGTAELIDRPSHAWFIGYAPYGDQNAHPIAFAVIVENGQYGGTAAAPIAADVVAAASRLAYFQRSEP
jgi:cell division protein FtsW (lipid II flippase)